MEEIKITKYKEKMFNQMDAKAKKVKLTETFIEAFSGIFRTSQTSKMELFVKIFNSIKPLTIFTKGSILNV